MRVEDFTMERDILNIGDDVQITEGKLPRAYYYMAEPAAAMSKNIPFTERILSTHGIVISKEKDGASWNVGIRFEN